MFSVVISPKGDNYPLNDKTKYNINERLSVPTRGQRRAPDFLYTNQARAKGESSSDISRSQISWLNKII
jgi:hypothetical protein